MIVKDDFNSSTVIDTTKWEVKTKDTGTTITISNGKLYITQSSGWSGGYLRTKTGMTIAELTTKFVAEFDFQIVGAFHNSGAGVTPCIGFVGSTTTRETTYYYSSTNQNLVFEIASASQINLGIRSGGDVNTTNYASCTGLNLATLTHMRIEVLNKNVKLYINNSTTPSINYTVVDSIWNALTNDIRFEYYLGNYSSGQYMVIDNAVMQTTFYKMLIQDSSQIKTTDGTLLSLIHEAPYMLTDFQTYGIDDINKINSTIINKINNSKYKVAIYKK